MYSFLTSLSKITQDCTSLTLIRSLSHLWIVQCDCGIERFQWPGPHHRKRLSQHKIVERNIRVLSAEGSMDGGTTKQQMPNTPSICLWNWWMRTSLRMTFKYFPLSKDIFYSPLNYLVSLSHPLTVTYSKCLLFSCLHAHSPWRRAYAFSLGPITSYIMRYITVIAILQL